MGTWAQAPHSAKHMPETTRVPLGHKAGAKPKSVEEKSSVTGHKHLSLKRTQWTSKPHEPTSAMAPALRRASDRHLGQVTKTPGISRRLKTPPFAGTDPRPRREGSRAKIGKHRNRQTSLHTGWYRSKGVENAKRHSHAWTRRRSDEAKT